MTLEGTKKPRRTKKDFSSSSGEQVDLGKLTLPTLKRYKRFHEIQDQDQFKIRAELIGAINQHFRNSPVPDEEETKIFFFYLARHQRMKADTKSEVKDEPK